VTALPAYRLADDDGARAHAEQLCAAYVTGKPMCVVLIDFPKGDPRAFRFPADLDEAIQGLEIYLHKEHSELLRRSSGKGSSKYILPRGEARPLMWRWARRQPGEAEEGGGGDVVAHELAAKTARGELCRVWSALFEALFRFAHALFDVARCCGWKQRTESVSEPLSVADGASVPRIEMRTVVSSVKPPKRNESARDEEVDISPQL
jgi:hypothetical protein